ncbi:MAG: hypothetical protein WD002_07660 [Pseudomonadales bacterium]
MSNSLDENSLYDWLDRHHVDVVRTHATTLDGIGVGKYVHRNKFTKTLPRGHAIADMALTQDIGGTPHLTFWHEQRQAAFGDIHMQPDLATLVSDGTDKRLGHCIADFVTDAGEPMALCPRSTLKRMVSNLTADGFEMKATFELEFYLFGESFDSIRRKKYQNLQGASASSLANIYLLRNAYHGTRFMDEVIKRLEWKGIAWEGWNDEAGVGQIELNLEPTDPVSAADNVVRTKQILYEVAVDMEFAVTFMSKLSGTYGNGMHIHHSLSRDGISAFFDATSDDNRSGIMRHWLAGLVDTLPGAVSFLCPTINSFRRMTDFSAVPTTSDWGEQNKSTALRTISDSAAASRIEYRIGAGDLNPYLALAVIIAGGMTGLERQLPLPAEFTGLAWGLPDGYPRLPNTIMKAVEAANASEALKHWLGEDFVSYWTKTRELEWLAFHTEGGDPASKSPTLWEFERYFALI